MFSGIVQERAVVENFDVAADGSAKLCLRSKLAESATWPLGASVAVNGLCLTIVHRATDSEGTQLNFELSKESLDRSTLATLVAGKIVNIESALSLGAPVGGHLVSGHIDGVGQVCDFSAQGEFWRLGISVAGEARVAIAPFLVSKGSIAIDGVSLTVNGVEDRNTESYFFVTLIPHTLQVTTLQNLAVGQKVNLEADMLAKYVNRYANFHSALGVG